MAAPLIRKPDYAMETFIVTAVVTFFVVVGIFFFYADKNEPGSNSAKIELQKRH